MKKFLLFAGDQYYPLGGWQDFKGSFDSVSDALVAASAGLRNTDLISPPGGPWDWFQIIDLASGKIVEEGISDVRSRSPDQVD